MRAVGLSSPIVWVDVEPVSPPSPWSSRVPANRAVLDGALAAYRDAGLRVGFYSTPSMWRDIVGTGPLRLPRVAHGRPVDPAGGPRALPTARSSRAVEAVLAQWYSTREDFDLLCPGRPAEDVLAEFFTRL